MEPLIFELGESFPLSLAVLHRGEHRAVEKDVPAQKLNCERAIVGHYTIFPDILNLFLGPFYGLQTV